MVDRLTKVTYTNPELALRDGSINENICIYRTRFLTGHWKHLAFHNVIFKNCIFKDTQLINCIFVKCVFKSCIFQTTGMYGCSLHSCVFERCSTENTFVNITTSSYPTDNPLICPDTDYYKIYS